MRKLAVALGMCMIALTACSSGWSEDEAADYVREHATMDEVRIATDEQISRVITESCRLLEDADGDAQEAMVNANLNNGEYVSFVVVQIAAVQSECPEYQSDYLDEMQENVANG